MPENLWWLVAQSQSSSDVVSRGEDWILESDWIIEPWVLALCGGLMVLFLAWNSRLLSGFSSSRLTLSQSETPGRGFVFWGIRSLAVVILLTMLGQWRLTRYETDLPDLIVLVDRSQSMQLPAEQRPTDSNAETRWEATRNLLLEDDAELVKRLSERYRLQLFTIGEKLKSIPADVAGARELIMETTPEASFSRLGDQSLQILRTQRGRSTAAVVMLSDGVVTDGVSLDAVADQFVRERMPLTIVRVGGTERPAQIAITELVGDSTAMVGDVVHVMARIEWTSRGEAPIEIVMVDAETGQALTSKTVVPAKQGDNDGEMVADLQFIAERPGVRQLQIRVEPLPGEVATDDNKGRLSVNVRNESFRVLLIQGGPSYEFRFLKHLLERATSQDGTRPLVELISVLQSGDARYAEQDRSAAQLPPVSGDALDQLDMVILSDCDPAALGEVLIEKIRTLVVEQGLSLVVLPGPHYLPAALSGTALGKILPVDPSDVKPPESATQPFALSLSPIGKSVPQLRIAEGANPWSKTPPFYWLMEAGRLRPGARVLLETEPSNAMRTPRPVVVSQLVGNGQVWMHLTDEFFRLEADQMDAEYYERYWLQLVRALARGRAKDGEFSALLTIQGERFRTGMSVPFEVELDSVRTAAADGKVTVAVVDSDGNRFAVEGHPDLRGDRFHGQFASLPPGSYRAVLTRPVSEENPPTDTFVVVSDSTEMRDSTVDVPLLARITDQTGGTLLRVQDGADKLVASLPRGREVRVRPLPPITIWNHWIVAAVLFGLLSAEWILRRRWGSL